MRKPKGPDPEQLVEVIIKGIEEKKGQKIVVLDLREIENSATDFFVVCEGGSNTQVNALSDSIEETVRKDLNDKPWHIEGRDTSEWVLLDYVNVVAHVFQKHIREFYNIEELWGDAAVRVIEEK